MSEIVLNVNSSQEYAMFFHEAFGEFLESWNDEEMQLFQSEEGIEDFADWLNDNKIEHLSNSAKAAMQMKADKATELRQRLLEIADQAIENYKSADINSTADGKKKFSLNELGLEMHTQQQIEQWKGNKQIQVYKSKEKFMKFVDDAMTREDVPGSKLYFGKISEEIGKNIYKNTGMKIDGYNLTLRSDEVRKILKNSHGNKKVEESRGQREITKED